MHFNVITLFPEMVANHFHAGVIGRAVSNDKMQITCVNPREFAAGVHQSVDDRPYGGGPGMVMRADILSQAVAKVRTAKPNTRVIAMCPKGKQFTHKTAQRLSELDSVTLVCGRYEGFDERFINNDVDETLSIGDFVLSGGELAACVVIDAIARLCPQVLGHEDSATNDSFATGLLECPHYTRPEKINGLGVPAVLQSGDHDAIRQYRQAQALGNTWVHKPTLFSQKHLSSEELVSLNAFLRAQREQDF